MANTPTLSLRVPLEHQQLVRDVVARFKADPGFADALRAMLPAVQATASPADPRTILHRLDAIERWIADHDAVPVQTTPEIATAAPPAAPVPIDVAEAAEPPAPPPEPPTGRAEAITITPTPVEIEAAPDAPADTTAPSPAPEPTAGKRTYHRATPEERADMVRRHAAGEKTADIAATVGVSTATVNRVISDAQGKQT